MEDLIVQCQKTPLAHWVRKAMHFAGICISAFQPHNVRTDSNSMAFIERMSFEKILKREMWSNASTFFSYCRHIEAEELKESEGLQYLECVFCIL